MSYLLDCTIFPLRTADFERGLRGAVDEELPPCTSFGKNPVGGSAGKFAVVPIGVATPRPVCLEGPLPAPQR